PAAGRGAQGQAAQAAQEEAPGEEEGQEEEAPGQEEGQEEEAAGQAQGAQAQAQEAAVSFDAVVRAVAGVPFMTPEQGRIVYDHVVRTGARDVLELGTAHGVGAAYLAAA